ncbi:MAG: hypothetical protein ABFD60_07750 [Bryobacteraceae bacterium]
MDHWIAKDGVNLDVLRPELARLELVIAGAYEEWNACAVVTCTDGDHKGRRSYHNPPWCAALDLRIHHIGNTEQQMFFYTSLKRAVDNAWPGLYDVLLESPGKENAHIHIECSPILAMVMFGSPTIQEA